MRAIHHLLLIALAGALVSACGGAPVAEDSNARLELLRRRAANAPEDHALQLELAEAELLWAEGDPRRARGPLEVALETSDPGLRARAALLSGWDHHFHLRLSDALDAYMDAGQAAARSDDAWAPVVAEVAFDSVNKLSGEVPGYRERVLPRLSVVFDEPGTLGHSALDAVRLPMERELRRAGEPEAAEALAERLGCLSSWRVAGPFGELRNTAFDETFEAEAQGPLRDSYEVQGEARETIDADATGCRISPRFSDGRSGHSRVAETFVEVDRAGPHLLRIDSAASFKLRVDGEIVLVVDRRDRISPRYVFVPVELPVGRHEISLKLDRSQAFSVALDRPGRLGAGYDPRRGVELPEATSPFEHLLVAGALSGRGDAVHALLAHERAPTGAPLVMTSRLGFIEDEPFIPADQKRDRGETLLRRIAEIAPDSYVASRFTLAREQDPAVQLEQLKSLVERFPEAATLRYQLIDAYVERSQLPEAEATLAQLRELYPSECRPLLALQELYENMGWRERADALTEDVMSCDASSTARLVLRLQQQRWDDAEAELERLGPQLEEEALKQLEIQLARASGEITRARELRESLLADDPDSGEAVRYRLDGMLARGEREDVVSLLDEAAARDPEDAEGLRNLRRDLTGEDELEPLRLDGAEVIEEYLASGAPYPDAPSVLVLDYMVTRIYPDGGSRNLIHQIVRVQSDEAKERFGELSLNGRILTLRAVKPDGRRFEPEAIRGVEGVQMPDLEIGDFVEYEYVFDSNPGLGGSFRSNGWVFASSSQPFRRSEMVVLMPADRELVVETTGNVPAAGEERFGELKVLRWRMDDVPLYEEEPNAVPQDRPIPTLRFAMDASWELHFRGMRDGLRSVAPMHPRAVEQCREIIDGATSHEEQVRRLAEWTRDEVEARRDGWSEMAPSMLFARRGHRGRLLHYLLRACGIDAEIAAARMVFEEEPSAIPNTRLYDTAIVLVPREGREPLAILGGDHADYRYVPSTLEGQEAVLLTGGDLSAPAQRTEVPPSPIDDRRRIIVDASFTEGRGGSLRVKEEHEGATAMFWRSRLEPVPEAELQRVMQEGYVAALFPGAESSEVEIAGLDASAGALTVGFEAAVSRLGRTTSSGRLLPLFFPTNLAQELARLPSREWALGVTGRTVDIETRYRGAARAIVDGLDGVHLEGPGGAEYRVTARPDGADLLVTRYLSVPTMVVPADQYPELARFSVAVSTVEAGEIPLP